MSGSNDAENNNTIVAIPKLRGLWYESARNRFRVRLYHKETLFHLSYHDTYPEALATLTFMRRKRTLYLHYLQTTPPQPPTPDPVAETTAACISRLRLRIKPSLPTRTPRT
jgi:hypothetical protein